MILKVDTNMHTYNLKNVEKIEEVDGFVKFLGIDDSLIFSVSSSKLKFIDVEDES